MVATSTMRSFRRPFWRLVLYYIVIFIALNFVLIPFWITAVAKGFQFALNRFILNRPDQPILFLLLGIFSAFILSMQLYNASLGFPVSISSSEIMQFPWVGKPRRIPWGSVTRIQIYDGLNGFGQYFYRLRLFAANTVILVSRELNDVETLIELIREEAVKRDVPIYRERKIGSGLRFGSWDIDGDGKSAGIPVERIHDIKAPKESAPTA